MSHDLQVKLKVKEYQDKRVEAIIKLGGRVKSIQSSPLANNPLISPLARIKYSPKVSIFSHIPNNIFYTDKR
jgi:hypothetical protein